MIIKREPTLKPKPEPEAKQIDSVETIVKSMAKAEKDLADDNEEKFEKLKGESETIAGFILELSGKFPRKGEKIKFDIYVFTIEAVDRKRIKQLKVTRIINA